MNNKRHWQHMVHKTQDEDKHNKKKTKHRKLKRKAKWILPKTGVNACAPEG